MKEPQTLGDFDDDAPRLRVWTTDDEWVIARSVSDAEGVYAEMGADPGDEVEWSPLPDGQALGIQETDGGEPVVRTCAEWCALRGRSYLGSVDG